MSTTTQIDLKAFCATSDIPRRWKMDEPFVVGGWRYATDGRIAVRVPAPGEPDSTDVIGTIAEVFQQAAELSPLPWPDAPCVRGMAGCPTCSSSGYIGRVTCEECDGSGECECSCCRQNTECDECEGLGYTDAGETCPQCLGKKRFEQDIYRPVGMLRVAAKYDALIRALPGVRWTGNSPCDKTGRVHFSFDGGDGVVMSLNVE